MLPSIALLYSPTSFLVPQYHFPFVPQRRQYSSSHSLNRSLVRSSNFSIGGNEGSVSSNRSSSTQQPPRAVFPGGYRRPEIRVPSILLQLDPTDVVPGGETLDLIDKAVSKVVSIVVLNGCNIVSGKQLYEAACLIKSVIRERAYFLIGERVDIASAVNASGVVLSDQGLPTLVARNMIMDSKPDSVYLPLVAKKVENLSAELASSNYDGADFLIYAPQQRDCAVQAIARIPVFISNPRREGDAYSLVEEAANVSVFGGGGLALSLNDLRRYGYETVGRLFETTSGEDEIEKQEVGSKVAVFDRGRLTAGFVKVKDKEKELVNKERELMLETIDAMRNAAPQMEEISLLVDAVAQIDEPFLLAIVGEFNSGKSTFINALLGEKYLKDGVVPTTNEITLLRYSDLRSGDQERCERHPDGQYICYLPFPILKEINIVDTPGTNVILQRQQRLTEEFVPRADLLMFVISADRPLTESEVSFLRYTQQWKKKIVFVLNKSDLYQNSRELDEAITFIRENSRTLLSTGDVTIYPVSSRSALDAKLSAAPKPSSEFDSFPELEKFLYSFLDGTTGAGMERMKLKLETPLRIAERLLSACKTIVKFECIQAKEDLASLVATMDSVHDYAVRMDRESTVLRTKITSLIDSTKSRIVDAIQTTLKLSNLDTVASYVLKGGNSALVPESLRVENEVVRPAILEGRKLLGEYANWMESNSINGAKQYTESFRRKGSSFSVANSAASLDAHELLQRPDKLSAALLEDMSVTTTSKVFDKEIREVFLGTLGGLGAAGLSASLLTSVLPTTLEDLLALGLCSAGGYVAVLNFPSRRKMMVDRVCKIADEIGKEMEAAMAKDLEESVGRMREFVRTIGQPYVDAAQGRLDKLMATQDELSAFEKKITALQVEIQNLHIS